MTIRITVKELSYHRNGICGVGFVAAKFTFRDGKKTRRATATVFNGDDDTPKFTGYCAVLVEGDDGKIDIQSHWRGDHFEGSLRSFIESPEGRVMMWPELYPTVEAYRAHEAKIAAMGDRDHAATGRTGA